MAGRPGTIAVGRLAFYIIVNGRHSCIGAGAVGKALELPYLATRTLVVQIYFPVGVVVVEHLGHEAALEGGIALDGEGIAADLLRRGVPVERIST